MDKNKVEVLINGKIYTLVGVESEDHIQKVARYIDKKMSMISGQDTSKVLNNNLLGILTSLNVADDYFKELDKNNELLNKFQDITNEAKTDENVIRDFEETINTLKEQNETLEKINSDLQMELDFVKQAFDSLKLEFDEYINTFGETSPTIKA